MHGNAIVSRILVTPSPAECRAQPLLLYPDRDEHPMRPASESSTLAWREPVSDGHVDISNLWQPDTCFIQGTRLS